MMKSTKPYILKAMYQWIIDSGCRPFIHVKTNVFGVVIPEGHDQDGFITLDIKEGSIRHLVVHDDHITFEAMFDEKVEKIRIPMKAILAIFAEENQEGWRFDEEDMEDGSFAESEEAVEDDSSESQGEGNPHIRIL